MIVCSCAVISDADLEQAVLEIMSQPNAPLPTPGVVYRHLKKRMNCCGCAPLATETIYAKMEDLEARGLVCPCACASARTKLKDIARRPLRASRNGDGHERRALSGRSHPQEVTLRRSVKT